LGPPPAPTGLLLRCNAAAGRYTFWIGTKTKTAAHPSRGGPVFREQRVAPMPVIVSCPQCGRGHRFPDSCAGRPTRCHACNRRFTVPTLGTVAPVSSLLAEEPPQLQDDGPQFGDPP